MDGGSSTITRRRRLRPSNRNSLNRKARFFDGACSSRARHNGRRCYVPPENPGPDPATMNVGFGCAPKEIEKKDGGFSASRLKSWRRFPVCPPPAPCRLSAPVTRTSAAIPFPIRFKRHESCPTSLPEVRWQTGCENCPAKGREDDLLRDL